MNTASGAIYIGRKLEILHEGLQSLAAELGVVLGRGFSVNWGVLLKATGVRHPASSQGFKDLAW